MSVERWFLCFYPSTLGSQPPKTNTETEMTAAFMNLIFVPTLLIYRTISIPVKMNAFAVSVRRIDIGLRLQTLADEHGLLHPWFKHCLYSGFTMFT